MFKFLNRKTNDDNKHEQTRHAESSRRISPIASLQMMGETAVATFTVTELTNEQGTHLLADLLDSLWQTGAKHFILDMQNVQFMDTPCLGCLVEATNQMATRGGRIALVNPDHGVDYLFKLTKLDRVFPICPDVPSAMTAVEGVPDKDGESFWGRLAG